MRCVSPRVLPEPAPAMTRSGPSACTTASSWSGLRPSTAGGALMTPPSYERGARRHGCLGPPPKMSASGGADGETAPMHGTQPVLTARGLVKSFRGTRAVDGIDLTVAPGERLGLL